MYIPETSGPVFVEHKHHASTKGIYIYKHIIYDAIPNFIMIFENWLSASINLCKNTLLYSKLICEEN